ncbi:hypothetical protein AMS68_003873 [Peltaster fructicola]|uniref:Fcf2 pre-rRNA processing C-terminal domain-containing protein n=1 Tax=Peltaster fructicola TaxID=286661 RepID=A0A6H0XUJ6_9PEZI|nr:hypothetical protein AMS68_003873 [Peltaster fructicola]
MAMSQRIDAADDDLTEEQINSLLSRATARLKAKAQTTANAPTRLTFPKLDPGAVTESGISTEGHLTKVKNDGRSKSIAGFRKVEDPVAAKALAKEKKQATAGPGWYDLPKTNLTPELKRDLQLLKMRGVLDPHRHYKKDNGKMAAPEYSMVGAIAEGATEFYNGRIENKKRKRTFVDEVLSGEQESGRFKKKYGDIQTKKTSGKKAFYKAVKAKRFNGVKKGG